MAVSLHWIPETLYNTSISSVVSSYSYFQKELRSAPQNVLFDVCYKLYKQDRLCQLGFEFCQLDVFSRILKVTDKRHLLHHSIQALMDHGAPTLELLSNGFQQHCNIIRNANVESKDRTISFGLSLAEFLSDSGWLEYSSKVAESSLTLCQSIDDWQHWKITLDCLIRLLLSQTANCKFTEAYETFSQSQKQLEKLKSFNVPTNLANVYGAFMAMYFSRSEYNEAYKWSIKTLKELKSNLSPNVMVDILRQSARACVVKREFKRAEMLIKQALNLTKLHFGLMHPKTADTLLDYGFYLLNMDSIVQSVKVYQTALDVRLSAFGGNNLHVAQAHEDLAYALYVQEYSSGKFEDAKEHAEKSLEMMAGLLPADHLLLASSKRVKALILEEIAIDNSDKSAEDRLLKESQELHMAALQMSKIAFGENNIQTAKHYGNLGRLYQSMKRYQEAEQMHLKAIQIKEHLLGPEDYEVALSVGHLASLYNYDMHAFKRAEKLYLQSINIGINLFGKGFSGLEYDYRGLLRVYATLGNEEKAEEYRQILHQWKHFRDNSLVSDLDTSPFATPMRQIQPELILREFLSIK